MAELGVKQENGFGKATSMAAFQWSFLFLKCHESDLYLLKGKKETNKNIFSVGKGMYMYLCVANDFGFSCQSESNYHKLTGSLILLTAHVLVRIRPTLTL